MSTGYTDPIKNGITFEQYAMGCARAFGACVEMRDEPQDKPIPEELKPSTYHLKGIEEAEEELRKLKGIDIETASKLSKSDHKKAMRGHKKRIKENEELRDKYVKMLTQVNNWEPPTEEHQGLKTFMQQQIEGSIKFDCNLEYEEVHCPKLLSGEEWLKRQMDSVIWDLEYHTNQNKEEIERAAEGTEWVKALRNSLGNV